MSFSRKRIKVGPTGTRTRRSCRHTGSLGPWSDRQFSSGGPSQQGPISLVKRNCEHSTTARKTSPGSRRRQRPATTVTKEAAEW